jgi:hypothetical protein
MSKQKWTLEQAHDRKELLQEQRQVQQRLAQGQGKPTPFHEWLAKIMEGSGLNVMVLSEQARLARDTVNRALGGDSSPETRRLLCQALELPWKSDEELVAAGFTPGGNGNRGRAVPSRQSPSLAEALKALARARPQMREEMQKDVLAAVREDRPAFLAIMTMGVMPGVLQPDDPFDGLREAMYGAHDRGLMLLFVVPNEAKVQHLKQVCGFENVPSAGQYVDRFKTYRQGYVEHCRAAGHGDPEGQADERMHLIRYDAFDVTGWCYMTSLMGDSYAYANVQMRVIDRGPASEGLIVVLPRNSRHEYEVSSYVRKALERTYRKGLPAFAREFIRRMTGTG